MESLRDLLTKTWPRETHDQEILWGCTIFDNAMRISFGECIDLSSQERKLLLYVAVLRQYPDHWPVEPSVELLELRERLVGDLGGEKEYNTFEYLRLCWIQGRDTYPSERVQKMDEVLEDASSLQTLGSIGLNQLLQDTDSTEEERVKYIRTVLLGVPACLYTETAYKLGISGLQPLLDYIEGKN